MLDTYSLFLYQYLLEDYYFKQAIAIFSTII